MKFDTKLIHGGERHTFPGIDNVIEPIFLSAVYRYHPDIEKPAPHVIPFKYGREDNPTVFYLERKIAELEQAQDALAFSSGLAAVNCVLSLYIEPEKTLIIAPLDLYGSTVTLLRRYSNIYRTRLVLTKPGTENLVENIKNMSKNVHRLIVFFESMSNPLLRVYDIEEICKACADVCKDIVRYYIVVDNTIPTMYSLRPLEHGATTVLYSATKYISGHNDCVGGFLAFSRREDCEKAWDLRRLNGTIMEPFTAYLIDRGLKTLHIRMRKHEENARAVAEFLMEHSKVCEVIFPGFSTHPDYVVACRYLRCLSGMVSFKIRGDLESALRVCKNVRIIVPGVSFGGAESIITHPYTTTHKYLTEEEKKVVGITENLLRLSVGLEDPDDIIEDLDQALKKAVP